MSLKQTGNHSDPHSGTIASHSSDDYYRDFGGFWIDHNAVTVDHLIYEDESITCEINGTPLKEL